LKSVDAPSYTKTKKYIFGLIDEMVDFIGKHRVVQVVTNNSANFKAAGTLLMQKREHLCWTPCAAHSIDLMLEDIDKDPVVHSTVAKAQSLTNFIYNHSWCLNLMRRETKGAELVRPGITRFATHFLALQSLFKQLDALKRMCTSEEWGQNIMKANKRERKFAKDAYETIFSNEFWSSVCSCMQIFEPLVKVLRMVDSDDKAQMGYLYEAIGKAKDEIKKNVRGYRKWLEIIDKRWDNTLNRDIHAAGISIFLYFF
jgi:hypothetical protein